MIASETEAVVSSIQFVTDPVITDFYHILNAVNFHNGIPRKALKLFEVRCLNMTF